MSKVKVGLSFLLVTLSNVWISNGTLDPGDSSLHKSTVATNFCTSENCHTNNRENCDIHEAIQAFRQKRLIEPIQDMKTDPYEKAMSEDEQRIHRSVVQNEQVNCGIRYSDSDHSGYTLRTFPNEYETNKSGFIITHYGRCGVCSSLQDLSVYLALASNLTVLARQCAFINFVADRLSTYCFQKLGFTEACSRIWMFNAKNTRRECWWVCMKSWIFSEPNNVRDDGKVEEELNPCLQCDDDHSGLLFKYYAGRTRRNSGIVTDIARPGDAIRNVTHCYF